MIHQQETTIMHKAIGYSRVSKDRGDKALGLAAQRQAIRDEAKRLGLDLSAVFTDNGVSGGARIEKRVELLAAMRALRAGDVLLVAKRDRLARDVLIAGWIEKEVKRRGATIVSASGEANGDGPYAKVMRTIIDAFAELERDLIRGRTKAALAVKRDRGERNTRHAPYGYRWADGRRVADSQEQKAIEMAKDLRADGHSLRDIATILHRKGFSNRSGRPLAAKVVASALRRAQ